jgi:hypothetical protein
MKQSTPPVVRQGDCGTAPGNADKWDFYRDSFLKLIAEEARLQIIAGMPSVDTAVQDEDALENAVVRVECARLVYNDSRNMLASALLSRVDLFERQPGLDARRRCVARVADLLSEFRGDSAGVSLADENTAEKIVSAAHARFLEQQRA